MKTMQGKTLGLLLAAAAAYGYYRYSKMTADQKTSLKRKGKDFLDKNISGVTDLFHKRSATTSNTNSY